MTISQAPVIPRRSTEVTGAWLSAVLSVRGEPVEISDVFVVPVGTGQTAATYRVDATYSANRGNLPKSYVIKLPAQDDTVADRVTLGYRSEVAFYAYRSEVAFYAYRSEVAFYARVAQHVAVPTPQCFYCDITDDGAEFALLLADLAPAVQGDQVVGCTAREARLAVSALAGVHGP